MGIADDALIRELLYETPQGRRLLQDSPVIPDLWIAFARAPTAHQDVLITPHSDARAAELAKRLRKADRWMREKMAEQTASLYGLSDPALAPLASQVAMQLSFPVLLGVIIPLTKWWWSIVQDARRRQIDMDGAALQEQLAAAFMGNGPRTALPSGLVWLARLVGLVHLSAESDVSEVAQALRRSASEREREASPNAALAVARGFLDIMPEAAFGLPVKAPPEVPVPHQLIGVHRVTFNRPVELAVNKSAATIKADAARRLFDISCSGITWAVIDSGIDVEHDAFADHAEGGSRVDAVYDVTILRELNNLALVEEALTSGRGHALYDELLRRQADPQDEGPVATVLGAHRDRLEAGDDIDYTLIRPFLRDCHPLRPADRHGTHVAGILGADWRKDGASKMTGVCPDIRLIDIRVMRPDGQSTEFEVISALEILRHHNSRSSSRLAIHGANLSLSIDHNLRGGDACGRTPICDECERTVNTGVCVVVAAGNRGNINVERLVENELRRVDIYLDASITDPGNAENVITVGATHRNRPHEYGVSFFSSRGPTGDGRIKPDLVAPGEKIVAPTPNQDFGELDGTSMAAPHVSGAAALIMARHAELIGKPLKIKARLKESATSLSREPYFQGAGLVDVLRALQRI